MKKIILILVLLSLMSVKKVRADILSLEQNPNYYFKLSKKNLGSITSKMYKISKDGKFYYNVRPTVSMFERKNYVKADLLLDLDIYKKITKVMYYGYGYKNHLDDAYYFATQFLIYELLDDFTVEIVDKDKKKSDYAGNEIAKIKKTIAEEEFKSRKYVINSNYLELTDPRIIEDFDLISDEINLKKIDKGYLVEFKEEKDLYEISLKAKNKILPADYWQGTDSADVLGLKGKWEDDSVLLVERKYLKEDDKIPEEQDLTTNNKEYEIIENLEVEMPDTFKNNSTLLLILFLIGNLYYVYKK